MLHLLLLLLASASTLGLAPERVGSLQVPVEGTVRAVTSGAPVQRFHLRAVGELADPAADPRRVTLERDIESPAGSYRIELAPGTWRLQVHAEGFAARLSGRLQVAEGEPVRGLDLALFRGARLSGRVVDQRTGEPVAGALVRGVLRVDHASSGPPDEVGPVPTDAQGNFTLTGFAPASWTIVAEKAGFLKWNRQTFDPIEDQSASGLAIRLSVGGTLEGVARAPGGEAVAGAEVWVTDVRRGLAGKAVTAEDGSFRVALVPPGSYRVEVRPLDEEGRVRPPVLAGRARSEEGQVSTVELAPVGS